MSTVGRIWNALSPIISKNRVPREPIPVSDGAPERPPLQPNQDYFGLRINQLYLSKARKWFTDIEPTVFATTEFLYGGKPRADPFIVGPRQDALQPSGMVISNTSICGPHPYRGGKLSYMLVLAQVPTNNVVRDFVDIVVSTGSTLDPSASVETWGKVSDVVLDGFQRLMGLEDTRPLLGVRHQIDFDADDAFRPGHFALIDADDIDRKKLWVTNDRLMYGATRESAEPYRGSDYLLYEITTPAKGMRSDISALPFQQLWDRAFEAAGKPGADSWSEAKGNMGALASALMRSPDLTRAQALDLRASYLNMLKAEHKATREREMLGAAEADRSVAVDVADILALE